ncbi:MAG TPA: protoglobin family protein [Actinomycetota bacterium]|nr:protoglobin family protein [Actinomycetota bacterium]
MALRLHTETGDAAEIDNEPLVTPGFHSLAEFANFGDYEALSIIETSQGLSHFAEGLPGSVSSYLLSRSEFAPFMDGVAGDPVDEALMKEWLAMTSNGPFDEAMAARLREMSHLPGGKSTFPGVRAALPPQMIVGLTSWVQGEILAVLGQTCDIYDLSAAGGAWMNQLILQLNIMLEPYLVEPTGPASKHGSTSYHELAEFAGFGPKEQQILAKTGPLLEAAAGGVISLAYTYLLSRPESAGYFQEEPHLAQRKKTLKAWWIRTATQPKDGQFHDYMSKVADAHVPGGGAFPHVVIPADLTLALMGWVEMRVMTALNTIAPGETDDYVFGLLGEPKATAEIGSAWMRMLTLQLGILLTPYLSDAAFSN